MRELRWEALEELLRRQPLAALAEVAGRHGGPVALVGGALRDALLGLPVADLDLVVEDHASEFRAAVAAAVGRHPVPIGDLFQDTHRMHLGGVQVDIARTLGSLDDDLRRRDFTINAMALPLPARSPRERLLDPFDGCADLRQGIVRMTSPDVLAEDPLRLMRAVRYAAALSGFALDDATRDRVAAAHADVHTVARERVQYEWGRILGAAGWTGGVELAWRTGLLEETLGAADDLAWVRAATAADIDLTTRLAAILLDVGESEARASRRLESWRWPRRQGRDAARVAAWARQAAAADQQQLAVMALQEPENAARVAALLHVGVRAIPDRDGARQADLLLTYIRRAHEPRWVTGADLRGWGMAAGPGLGEGLRRIAVGQLQRRWPDSGECRRHVRERLRAGEAP